jgi:addiction module HigA family antidote
MKLQREPTTPGEILSEEFLKPLALSQTDLASHIGCDVKVVNRIVNGRSAVTAEMAIRLSAALRMSPGAQAQCPASCRHLQRRPQNEEAPAADSPRGLTANR